MRDSRGFTLVEMLVATAFFMTATGMALALLGSAVPSVRADTEANRLVSLLQVARETAITRQRDVEVRVDTDDSSIALIRHDEGVEVPMSLLVFESGVQLLQFAGMDAAPPDGYGANGVVDFGGATSLTFISDGSFVGQDDIPLNGTFYLGVAGKQETARAITLTGTTARPRMYRWRPTTGGASGWVPR